MEHPPTEAELRVLDAALDEQLDGLAPPDLWPRVQAALVAAGGSTPAPSPRAPHAMRQRQRWRRPLWVALAMAAASAVVVAVWLDRPGPGDRGDHAPLPAWTLPLLDVDARGPRDLAELQRWLAAGGLRDAAIRAENVFARELGRTVPLSMFDGLEGWFESGTTVHLRYADRAQFAAALQRAVAAPLPRTARPWQHVVDLKLGEHDARLLVRSDADGPLNFAVAAPGGAFGIALDAAVALLEPELREVTAATVAARGIAIGDAGFDALPATATRLRLHDVSATAFARIGRFTALQQIDLRDALAWQNAVLLRGLAAFPLHSLSVDGSRLDAAGIQSLGTLRSLRELFVIGPGDYVQAIRARAPVLAGDVVGALLQLQDLEELGLADAGLTDRGLASLALLPKLSQLGLVGCTRVTGSGLTAFQGRAMKRLGLCTSGRAIDLAAVAGWRSLESLFLGGAVARASLAEIHAIPGLRRLSLMAEPPLTATDMPALYGATQLQKIELFGADALDEDARAALRAALPQCSISFEKVP